MNERLSGKDAHDIRKRLEHLRYQIDNQEMVYDFVTKSDTTATLKLIEDAHVKVSKVLAFSLRLQSA